MKCMLWAVSAILMMCTVTVNLCLADDEEVELKKVECEVEADHNMTYVIEIQCEEVDDSFKSSIHLNDARMPTIYYDQSLGHATNVRIEEVGEDERLCAFVTFHARVKGKDVYVGGVLPVEEFYITDPAGDRKKILVRYQDDLPRVVRFVPRQKK